jgi:hypothetical protein
MSLKSQCLLCVCGFILIPANEITKNMSHLNNENEIFQIMENLQSK